MKYLLLFLFSFVNIAIAQERDMIYIGDLPTEGLALDKGWKYREGDDRNWAKPGLDETGWIPIDPTKELRELPHVFNSRAKWLRLDFEIKTKRSKATGITITHAGASEVYLNGRLLYQFGHFDTDSTKVRAYDPLEYPIHFPADSLGRYTLAVRYALQPGIRYSEIYTLTKNRLFSATLFDLNAAIEQHRYFKVFYTSTDVFKVGFFLILFILHLAYYLFQRQNKTHLILAIYLLANVLAYAFKLTGQNLADIAWRYYVLNLSIWMYIVGLVTTFLVFYRIAKIRIDIYFYVLLGYSIIHMLVTSLSYSDIPWHILLVLISSILSSILFIRLTRIGLKKKIKGFSTLGIAVLVALLCLWCTSTALAFWDFGFSTLGYKEMNNGMSPYFIEAVFAFGGIAIPIGLSLFMGIEGNEVNKALSQQLAENEQLKNKAIEQEQEKQQILATQNETLEKQVTERTAALNDSLETLKATQDQLVLSEKLASLGELTAGIAHEIQNPLNFVNNFSELSVDLAKEISEEIHKPAMDRVYVEELLTDLSENQEKIHHHGKRASNIVKGMLEHSRERSDVKTPTDLSALADEYLRLSYHGLRAKDKGFNANFKTDFDTQLPQIMVVPQDMGRVFLNLFNNAFYAVNEKRQKNPNKDYQPMVEVSARLLNQQAVITVRDNGIGMSESVRAKVFQPFFTTKPTGMGTGLGLSISYDIITKGHSGTFEIDTKEGEFTEFIIQIPTL